MSLYKFKWNTALGIVALGMAIESCSPFLRSIILEAVLNLIIYYLIIYKENRIYKVDIAKEIQVYKD